MYNAIQSIILNIHRLLLIGLPSDDSDFVLLR